MDKKEQKPETKRVIEVYQFLLKKGVVNNPTDFANKCNNFSPASFGEILRGNREAPLSLQYATCRIFNVREDYMIKGEGGMFPAIYRSKPRELSEDEKRKDVMGIGSVQQDNRSQLDIAVEATYSLLRHLEKEVEGYKTEIEVCKAEIEELKKQVKYHQEIFEKNSNILKIK